MFEPGTQEWQEIKDIQVIRKWTRLYGHKAAMEMYDSLRKLRRVRVPLDEYEGIQLKLF
jgi:hypothetical protein